MEYFEAALVLLASKCREEGGVGVVGASKGGDLALALAVTQGPKVEESLTNCSSAVKKTLTGSGCCYHQRLSGKCRRRHHKEGEDQRKILKRERLLVKILRRGIENLCKYCEGERILVKILQGQTIFPGLGLRTDFKPKPREDGTLDCLGAMQVIF